jgi:hypothetical protein
MNELHFSFNTLKYNKNQEFLTDFDLIDSVCLT